MLRRSAWFCSDNSALSAAKEIAVYFKPEELLEYSTTLSPWVCAKDEM